MSPDEVRDRLKQLFVALYRDNDHERGNAAGALYRFLIAQNIHAKDVDLLVGLDLIERNKQVIEYLESEVRRLATENAYFRRRVSSQIIRDAAKAGVVDISKWFAIYDWITETWGDPPPSDWYSRLAKLLHVSAVAVKRWETGLDEIPADTLDILQNSLKPRIKPKKPAKRLARSSAKPPTERQIFILQGLDELVDATIRKLSFHLYGEPDTNENLADAVSIMYGRNWLERKRRIADADDRSIWTYWLSETGVQVLNETSAD